MEDSSATCGTVDAAAQKRHAFVAAVLASAGTGIFRLCGIFRSCGRRSDVNRNGHSFVLLLLWVLYPPVDFTPPVPTQSGTCTGRPAPAHARSAGMEPGASAGMGICGLVAAVPASAGTGICGPVASVPTPVGTDVLSLPPF